MAVAVAPLLEPGAGRHEADTAGERAVLWNAVDRLVDCAPRLSDLRAHGLHLLAARRWRELGREVPLELRQAQRGAALVELMVPTLLERLRASCSGPLVLMKGPEVAALYPDPAARTFRDLDLLVPDAEATQRQLLAAGFEVTGDPALYEDIHHLRPLVWPGLPLIVEIHRRPKWVDGLVPPETDELIAGAVPSALGIDGILALPPAEHTLVLAVHAWAHVPLGKLINLVDVAAASCGVDERELAATAESWDMERLWHSTRGVVGGLFFGQGRGLISRTWARNLRLVRERTVAEAHLQRWVSPFSALPARLATARMAREVKAQVLPEPGETWSAKLRRTRRAIRDAPTRVSEHDRGLEMQGIQGPSRKGVE